MLTSSAACASSAISDGPSRSVAGLVDLANLDLKTSPVSRCCCSACRSGDMSAATASDCSMLLSTEVKEGQSQA